jgi:hypothetical protein
MVKETNMKIRKIFERLTKRKTERPAIVKEYSRG